MQHRPRLSLCYEIDGLSSVESIPVLVNGLFAARYSIQADLIQAVLVQKVDAVTDDGRYACLTQWITPLGSHVQRYAKHCRFTIIVVVVVAIYIFIVVVVVCCGITKAVDGSGFSIIVVIG